MTEQTTETLNYYEVLGIEKGTSPDKIKKAFRNLAMKWHPDKNPTNREEAEKQFKLISEAFEVLGDVGKKERYDAIGHAAYLKEATSVGGVKTSQHFSPSSEAKTAYFPPISDLKLGEQKLLSNPWPRGKAKLIPDAQNDFIQALLKISSQDDLWYVFSRHTHDLSDIQSKLKKFPLLDEASKKSAIFIQAQLNLFNHPSRKVKEGFDKKEGGITTAQFIAKLMSDEKLINHSDSDESSSLVLDSLNIQQREAVFLHLIGNYQNYNMFPNFSAVSLYLKEQVFNQLAEKDDPSFESLSEAEQYAFAWQLGEMGSYPQKGALYKINAQDSKSTQVNQCLEKLLEIDPHHKGLKRALHHAENAKKTDEHLQSNYLELTEKAKEAFILGLLHKPAVSQRHILTHLYLNSNHGFDQLVRDLLDLSNIQKNPKISDKYTPWKQQFYQNYLNIDEDLVKSLSEIRELIISLRDARNLYQKDTPYQIVPEENRLAYLTLLCLTPNIEATITKQLTYSSAHLIQILNDIEKNKEQLPPTFSSVSDFIKNKIHTYGALIHTKWNFSEIKDPAIKTAFLYHLLSDSPRKQEETIIEQFRKNPKNLIDISENLDSKRQENLQHLEDSFQKPKKFIEKAIEARTYTQAFTTGTINFSDLDGASQKKFLLGLFCLPAEGRQKILTQQGTISDKNLLSLQQAIQKEYLPYASPKVENIRAFEKEPTEDEYKAATNQIPGLFYTKEATWFYFGYDEKNGAKTVKLQKLSETEISSIKQNKQIPANLLEAIDKDPTYQGNLKFCAQMSRAVEQAKKAKDEKTKSSPPYTPQTPTKNLSTPPSSPATTGSRLSATSLPSSPLSSSASTSHLPTQTTEGKEAKSLLDRPYLKDKIKGKNLPTLNAAERTAFITTLLAINDPIERLAILNIQANYDLKTLEAIDNSLGTGPTILSPQKTTYSGKPNFNACKDAVELVKNSLKSPIEAKQNSYSFLSETGRPQYIFRLLRTDAYAETTGTLTVDGIDQLSLQEQRALLLDLFNHKKAYQQFELFPKLFEYAQQKCLPSLKELLESQSFATLDEFEQPLFAWGLSKLNSAQQKQVLFAQQRLTPENASESNVTLIQQSLLALEVKEKLSILIPDTHTEGTKTTPLAAALKTSQGFAVEVNDIQTLRGKPYTELTPSQREIVVLNLLLNRDPGPWQFLTTLSVRDRDQKSYQPLMADFAKMAEKDIKSSPDSSWQRQVSELSGTIYTPQQIIMYGKDVDLANEIYGNKAFRLEADPKIQQQYLLGLLCMEDKASTQELSFQATCGLRNLQAIKNTLLKEQKHFPKLATEICELNAKIESEIRKSIGACKTFAQQSGKTAFSNMSEQQQQQFLLGLFYSEPATRKGLLAAQSTHGAANLEAIQEAIKDEKLAPEVQLKMVVADCMELTPLAKAQQSYTWPILLKKEDTLYYASIDEKDQKSITVVQLNVNPEIVPTVVIGGLGKISLPDAVYTAIGAASSSCQFYAELCRDVTELKAELEREEAKAKTKPLTKNTPPKESPFKNISNVKPLDNKDDSKKSLLTKDGQTPEASESKAPHRPLSFWSQNPTLKDASIIGLSTTAAGGGGLGIAYWQDPQGTERFLHETGDAFNTAGNYLKHVSPEMWLYVGIVGGVAVLATCLALAWKAGCFNRATANGYKEVDRESITTIKPAFENDAGNRFMDFD
ncbi:MAG: DnaJ domain-containing protein [Gammaproteobacteria bacterium]